MLASEKSSRGCKDSSINKSIPKISEIVSWVLLHIPIYGILKVNFTKYYINGLIVFMKNHILNQITNYYLNSGEFNGLPLAALDITHLDLICQLIDEDKIEVLSENFVINPYIKAMKLNIDKEIQKKEVTDNLKTVVLYPTEQYLKSLNIQSEKPFTKMLIDGQEKLKILYFNIEILETYFQDPRYKVFWSDYRGRILVLSEYLNDNLVSEYIKDFGIGYHKIKELLELF